jgi:hypothetical protein
MIKKSSAATQLVLLLVVLAVTFSLSAAQGPTMILNGRSTDVPVIFLKNRAYVDLEALASALNGSVASSGAAVALTVPSLSGSTNGPTAQPPSATTAHAPTSSDDGGSHPRSSAFSREFLNAGIEEMSTLREWHAALESVIQNGIPFSEGLLQPYRAQATTKLRLAWVAATTSADRDAYQLLNNVYQNMEKLANKYINMRASLTYIAPDALKNDDLNQRIMDCGRALRTMAANGEFSEDASCH